MFPFIDYVKQTFNDDGTDQSVFNPTYKCAVMLEITDTTNSVTQTIYIDDDGALGHKMNVYETTGATSATLGGGFIMNANHELRANPGGSDLAFTLHIFRLPEEIS